MPADADRWTVLVAGCGYVGEALAGELAAAGHRVLGLRRSDKPLPPGVRRVVADVTDPATLRALPPDIDRVVYAVSPNERSEEAYQAAYVDGPANLDRALASAGARVTRSILVTSTAVYGQNDGGWVDEASPTEPTSFSGRLLLDGERSFLAGDGERSALRLAGIYGPDRTWLVRRVHSGEVHVEGEDHAGPPRYGNRIHRDDCAGALHHLLGAPTVAPVYVGVDDAPDPLADVYRFVADRLGVAHPTAGEVGRGRGGNKRCANRALTESGYRLRVPSYREGYPAIVERYLAESTSA